MSDVISGSWRSGHEEPLRKRITDEAFSRTISTRLEMRLDRDVHHQIILFSAGYLPGLSGIQYRMMMNDAQELLIQAIKANVKEGKSVQLMFMTPSLELEVSEAIKKGYQGPVPAQAAILQSLMTGSRSGRFFEDARSSLPVRANFIRSLQDFEKGGILRRLTLKYAMSPDEDLLPITRARALFQSLECLKNDSVTMLPEILVCIPEMGVRTALAEMVGGGADRSFWDRVKILDNNNVAAGKVQAQLLKVLRKFHKDYDADFILKEHMASQRLDPKVAMDTRLRAFSPIEGIVDLERYVGIPLPDLSRVLLAFNIDTNTIMEVVKDKYEINVAPGQRCEYFIQRLAPALVAEIEELAKSTGTNTVVFLARIAQMECLHTWERRLIGKSGSDVLAPGDHTRLDDANQGRPAGSRPGYARRAMRALVERLKESPHIEFYEDSREHGMVSLVAKHDPDGPLELRALLRDLGWDYRATLPIIPSEDQQRSLEVMRWSADQLPFISPFPDDKIDALAEAIDRVEEDMPNRPQDRARDLLARLRLPKILEECPLSGASSIIYEFLDLVKTVEADERHAGRKVVGVCLTADQFAAHLAMQADPTRLAAPPLEQGKHTYAGPDNQVREYTGGRVRADVFLFNRLADGNTNVFLQDKEPEPASGETEALSIDGKAGGGPRPVRKATRLCLRSVVAASIAQLVEHQTAEGSEDCEAEDPQPQVRYEDARD